MKIIIDMTRKCRDCGNKGVTPGGRCLSCITAGIKRGEYDHIVKKHSSQFGGIDLLGAVATVVECDGERKCRVCGCTDYNCQQCIERTGEPCHWVEENLCSACQGGPDVQEQERIFARGPATSDHGVLNA